MKIPKFKPPCKSEHDKSYLSMLVLMLAVFMLALIGIVSQGATVHATVVTPDLSAYTYTLSLDYQYTQNEDGLPSYDRSSTIVAKHPIYGYYQSGEWRFALVDFENQTYYKLADANNDNDIDNMYRIQSARINFNAKSGTTTTTLDYTGGGSYQTAYSEYSAITNCIKIVLNDWSTVRSCSATVFESEDALKAFIETGVLAGVIHEGDFTIDGRDFSGEYDPDVPVPQLKSLSYNGFTVANAADNLELDLVVESWFYGYELKTVGGTAGFFYDEDWLIGSNSYDCTSNSDIGYTKSTYNLYEDFGCTSAVDLANYGVEFFNDYPKISDLPTYDFWKYGKITLAQKYDEIQMQYGATKKDADAYRVAVPLLETSKQAITKYYVRFYELRPNDTGYSYVPGQWYSYTYRYDNKGVATVVVSPVGGDEDGNPVDENPQKGEQDENGDITIGDPPINYSGDSLLEIITGILGDLTEMIAAFQDFASFLTEGLSFIPENIWTLIRIGFGLSVIFLIWRFVVK